MESETYWGLVLEKENEELVKAQLPKQHPKEGEVLIKVGAAGICRSDLHYIGNTHKLGTLPHVLGHEISGTVTELGENISENSMWIKKGSRVIVHYLIHCGKCDYCLSKNEQFCECPLIPPVDIFHPSSNENKQEYKGMFGKDISGGYQQYICVPSRNIIEIPDDLSFAHASVLGCAFSTSLHALYKGRIKEGEKVAVIGAGGLGMAALVLAKAKGAQSILAIDIQSSKLQLASSLGAQSFLLPISQTDDQELKKIEMKNHSEDIKKIIDSKYGVDVVLELVGSSDSTALAAQCIAPKGRIVFVGIGPRHSLNCVSVYETIIGKEAELIGCSDHLHGEIKELIDLASQKRLALDQIVTQIIPFDNIEEINKVFVEMRNGTSPHIRSVIVFE